VSRRIIASLLAASALCLLPRAAPAAEAERSPAGILRRSNETLRRFTLDNGMTGLARADHSAPVVAIQIWVGSGAVHEGEWLGAGLSHFVEHMIFKGTPSRGVGVISREISDAGGDLNAYTAQDRTVFHATLPARNWKTGLDVLADAVMNASFPAEEWEKEREVILREFAMGRDDPDREIGKLLWETAYRVHPYRLPVIGYEDVFKSAGRDDLAGYFRRNYTPDNMMVAVVGDVDAAEVERSVRGAFAGFARRARPPPCLPGEPPQLAPRFARRTGPYEVSRLLWACHTVPLSHPDAPALDVLAEIVGAGRSSRLVDDLKETKQLVYEIDAWSATPKDPGLFGISATFAPSNEAAVIEAIRQQVDAWPRAAFSEDELAKARRTVLVGALSGLQTMDGQASSYASGEFYAANPRLSEWYVERVETIAADDLRTVAARYLAPDNRTLVILSPEETGAATGSVPLAAAAAGARKLLLPTGVPLIVREDRRLPFVHFCAAFGGGLLSETEENNGITQLLSDLLTRGTTNRSAQEIAETVEKLGGSLSPFAGRNSFGLQARCLAEDADTFMDLLSDCLLNPTLPEEEIAKQRDVQMAAIRQQREQPFFVADEALRKSLFPNHPYRWTPLGTEETVRRITRDGLRAYFGQQVVGGNLVLSVFGDVTAEDAAALAGKWLARLPDRPAPARSPSPARPELPARMEQREPKQQTIVLVGFPGVDLKDPRRNALGMIQNALSGLSSDLADEIREKRGLVYYVGAVDRPGLEPGLFALYAGTREEKAGEVERLMREELDRLMTGGLRPEEFNRAREQLIAEYQMSLQNTGGLAMSCALNELYGLGFDYDFGLEERLKALTGDDLRAAAASLFIPARQAVSVVLPEAAAPAGTETGPD
jgi:zinc protease